MPPRPYTNGKSKGILMKVTGLEVIARDTIRIEGLQTIQMQTNRRQFLCGREMDQLPDTRIFLIMNAGGIRSIPG